MVQKDVELDWTTKKDILDRISSIRNVSLPFQVVETVKETKATREAKKAHGLQKTLYDSWSGGEGETFDSGWKNKLIWGDNKYVIAALLQQYAGKIELIYIDPPFATGADFFIQISVQNMTVGKEPTAIEQKAYRDTWG
ncbi:MAG: DNA methyltransferase, partial [Nitrososphaera sp.]